MDERKKQVDELDKCDHRIEKLKQQRNKEYYKYQETKQKLTDITE